MRRFCRNWPTPMRSPAGACVVWASTTPSEKVARSAVASADFPRT